MQHIGTQCRQSLRGIFLAAALSVAAPFSALADNAVTDIGDSANHITTSAPDGGVSLSVGGVSFASPWMLLGLGSLPLLWWLMRSIPPRPREEDFPAIRFLFDLESDEQEVSTMPLWQRMIYLTAAASAVTALADPVIDPPALITHDNTVMLVIDNGWSASFSQEQRDRGIEKILNDAVAGGNQVILLPAAPAPEQHPDAGQLLDAAYARTVWQEIAAPNPWPVDYSALIDHLDNAANIPGDGTMSVIWLNDGLGDDSATELADRLRTIGNVKILTPGADESGIYLLERLESESPDSTILRVERLHAGQEETRTLICLDDRDRTLCNETVTFDESSNEAFITLPQTSDTIAQVRLVDQNSAGTTLLFDDQWQERAVGIAGDNDAQSLQTLLSETGYLNRALAPYAVLHSGRVESLLEKELSVIILGDSVQLSRAETARLSTWVENGGTLLRFAGPRMAAQRDDMLMPVDIRAGSYRPQEQSDEPVSIVPFRPESPFYGLTISDQLNITEKTLVREESGNQGDVWARMSNGAPLVSAAARGEGKIILIHTTANTEWGDFALSGLYVEMLQRITNNARPVTGSEARQSGALEPYRMIDPAGRMTPPAPHVTPLTIDSDGSASLSPQNPPGLYGTTTIKVAHNLSSQVKTLSALSLTGDDDDQLTKMTYAQATEEKNLSGYLWGGAMALTALSLAVLLAQNGHLPTPGRSSGQASAAHNRRKPRPGEPQP